MPPSWRRLLPRGLRLRTRMRLKNGRWRLATPDRVVLEDVIAAGFLARNDIRKVLDVGVAWYTKSYPRLYAGVDYHTIDLDPRKQLIAGPNHRTLSMTALGEAYEPCSFDLVVCNGVFGWGVNTPDVATKAIDAAGAVLRPGGWMVVGWNDIPGRRVDRLDELLAQRFDRAVFPPVGEDHILTPTHYAHRYDFFTRR